jgi:GNAT superfamily N-acetyltransferase
MPRHLSIRALPSRFCVTPKSLEFICTQANSIKSLIQNTVSIRELSHKCKLNRCKVTGYWRPLAARAYNGDSRDNGGGSAVVNLRERRTNRTPMPPKLQIASVADVSDLVSLRTAVHVHLASQFGNGFWSPGVTDKGVLFAMRTSNFYVARHRNRLLATLTLSTRKPWAIDKKYFRPSKRPLYLTAMAVHPTAQRKGIGKHCMEEAREIAQAWPRDAIRLDAYAVDAGASEFYRKCGFTEVGRASYRGVPLVYLEMLI